MHLYGDEKERHTADQLTNTAVHQLAVSYLNNKEEYKPSKRRLKKRTVI